MIWIDHHLKTTPEEQAVKDVVAAADAWAIAWNRFPAVSHAKVVEAALTLYRAVEAWRGARRDQARSSSDGISRTGTIDQS